VTANRTDVPFATATSDQNDDVMMMMMMNKSNTDERVVTADVITQTRLDNRGGERLDGVATVTVHQQLHEVASVIGSKRTIHDDDRDNDGDTRR
jgi:hypothetical protein